MGMAARRLRRRFPYSLRMLFQHFAARNRALVIRSCEASAVRRSGKRRPCAQLAGRRAEDWPQNLSGHLRIVGRSLMPRHITNGQNSVWTTSLIVSGQRHAPA